MPMSPGTIEKLNRIIDGQNNGVMADNFATEFECHTAQIRAFIALARRLGTKVKRNSGQGAKKMSPEERAILGNAMREAHKKIAAARA